MSKTRFLESVQGIDLRHKSMYQSDSKISLVKTKCKNMRTFHVQLLFQAATEDCSNHHSTSNNTHTILPPFNYLLRAHFKRSQERLECRRSKRSKLRKRNKELLHYCNKY